MKTPKWIPDLLQGSFQIVVGMVVLDVGTFDRDQGYPCRVYKIENGIVHATYYKDGCSSEAAAWLKLAPDLRDRATFLLMLDQALQQGILDVGWSSDQFSYETAELAKPHLWSNPETKKKIILALAQALKEKAHEGSCTAEPND